MFIPDMRSGKINLVRWAWAAILLVQIWQIPAWTQDSAKKPVKEHIPATAPQVREVLPSYEGQQVTSVEIAGRPDLQQQQVFSLLKPKTRRALFPNEN